MELNSETYVKALERKKGLTFDLQAFNSGGEGGAAAGSGAEGTSEGENGEGSTAGAEGGDNPTQRAADKTYNRDDVNKIVATEVKRAIAAAEKARTQDPQPAAQPKNLGELAATQAEAQRIQELENQVNEMKLKDAKRENEKALLQEMGRREIDIRLSKFILDEDPETTLENLTEFADLLSELIQKGVDERFSKTKTPKAVGGTGEVKDDFDKALDIAMSKIQ